jgi:hypothetical protein
MADFDPSGVWEARSLAGTVTTFNIGPVQPNGSSLDRQTYRISEPVRGLAGRLAACLYSRLIGLTELHTCLAVGLMGTVP